MWPAIFALAAQYGADQGMRYANSQQQFAWNGKDLRRNVRFQKRMIRFQNEQSKAMSLWSAQNMPKATMDGLKSAGLNPLLAAGGNTNVSPMVASSAASVPSNQSYAESTGSPVSFGDMSNLFSGVTSGSAKASKASSKASIATSQATEAEQNARREFFESPEGRQAVKDKLEMQYGPQSAFELVTKGASSAKSTVAEPDSFGWLFGGQGRVIDPKTGDYINDVTTHRDDNGNVVVARKRTYKPQTTINRKRSRRDNHQRIDNSRHYHISFGGASSAKSQERKPVWYNGANDFR